jgi:thiosulfate/3-mercaptopyruvate sulfurtransferase
MIDYRTLVSVDALARHLDDPDWRVVDTRFSLADPEAGRQLYRQAHIPGAAYLHLDEDLSAPVTATSGRHPLPDPAAIEATLRDAGICDRTQVVAYDAAGGGIASRLWWMLRWLGHPRAAVLDGGFTAWQEAGHRVTAKPARPPYGDFTARPDDAAQILLDVLRTGLARDELLLVDAREGPRFLGEAEPIDAVAGRIPGAVNLPWQANLSDDGLFLAGTSLRHLWEERLGRYGPGQAVCMCGSGVTACADLLAMEVAGLSGGRLYAGSWSEWIRDPTRPVATGPE